MLRIEKVFFFFYFTFLKGIDYVKIFLESYINILKAKAKSMIPGISRDDVLNILFPSPPLSEQQRIVDKVNQLIPQISKL